MIIVENRSDIVIEPQEIIADTINLQYGDNEGTHNFTCIENEGIEITKVGHYAPISGIQEIESTKQSQEIPWVAFIKINNLIQSNNKSNGISSTCGGVLISQRLIISAAHCCCDATHCKARQVTIV